jgi:hypothetical protein
MRGFSSERGAARLLLGTRHLACSAAVDSTQSLNEVFHHMGIISPIAHFDPIAWLATRR